MTKRDKESNIWLDENFIQWIRELKLELSMKDIKSKSIKKPYSDGDISRILITLPELSEIRKKLVEKDGSITSQIRIQMDRRKNG